MALRITRATDPITVERLVQCIYAPPGIGKTSIAFTSHKPLLLDFDGGVHRAVFRLDTVKVEAWDDVAEISEDDLRSYRTLIFDTAGRALDVLSMDIIKKNPKMGRSGGALTLQGFGELKARFIGFTRMIRSFGLDIVLLAHSDEQKNGDDLIERIDVQGGSKNEIYKVADMMGRLYIRNGKRYLNFNPSETAYGKNPGQLSEVEIPDLRRADNRNFLGELSDKVKAELNKMTAEQQENATVLAEWQIKFDSANTPDEYNALIDQMGKLPDSVKTNVGRLWLKIGKAKGWEQDKETKQFRGEPFEAFTPISVNGKDGMTKKQEKEIQELAEELDLQDVDSEASKVFNMDVKIKNLSKEGAERFIIDLKTKTENVGGPF
jgi:hypothetical protein